jgi:hypothetical protein
VVVCKAVLLGLARQTLLRTINDFFRSGQVISQCKPH